MVSPIGYSTLPQGPIYNTSIDEGVRDSISIINIWNKLADLLKEKKPIFKEGVEYANPCDVKEKFNEWFTHYFSQISSLWEDPARYEEVRSILSMRHVNRVRGEVVDSAFEQFAADRSTLKVWQLLAEMIKVSGPDFTSLRSPAAYREKASLFVVWMRLNREKLLEIKKLCLKEMNLTALPPEVCTLVGLEELGCWQNRLTHLPDNFGDLENLKILFLDDNSLHHLPDSMGNLRKLSLLNLDKNDLTTLPDSMAACQKLETLLLRENPLTTIPQVVGELKYSNVTFYDKRLWSPIERLSEQLFNLFLSK